MSVGSVCGHCLQVAPQCSFGFSMEVVSRKQIIENAFLTETSE